MVNLSEPQLSDQGWLADLALRSNLRSADYSFGVIYCWSDMMHPFLARVGDRLLLRNVVSDDVFYSYPVGSGDARPVLEAIREDAAALGAPVCICGITPEHLPELADWYGKEPELTTDKRFSDYVYSAESLATLSGKKMHQKKNHLNRFMAENDWSFEPITPANIGECQELSSEWFIDNSEERDAGYTSEIRAIRKTLEHYFELGFDGGLIRVAGAAAAFTIGERIGDTCYTHFEKAQHHANGGYTIINQQFAAYMLEKYPDLKYMNREEDMGFENLRKAKESYHPEFMVDKYTAVWRL